MRDFVEQLVGIQRTTSARVGSQDVIPSVCITGDARLDKATMSSHERVDEHLNMQEAKPS